MIKPTYYTLEDLDTLRNRYAKCNDIGKKIMHKDLYRLDSEERKIVFDGADSSHIFYLDRGNATREDLIKLAYEVGEVLENGGSVPNRVRYWYSCWVGHQQTAMVSNTDTASLPF